MRQRILLATDATMVVIGVALLAMLVSTLSDRARRASPQTVTIDGEAIGIDFAATKRTLLLVLRSDCFYCEKSKPFYARLGAHPRSGVQIAVVAPPSDVEIAAYTDILNPDLVLFPDPRVMPVRGTPTLFVVDQQGMVRASWLGLLDMQGEEEVLTAFSGT